VQQEPAPQPSPALDERLLKAAEQRLAAYVGPLAKILVRRAAGQTSDLDEFCRTLAQELPDKQQQSDFCSALRRMALS
jgi:serine/threonine-protein kinase